MDEKLFAKILDEIEASDGLTDEDKDLMRNLAKKEAGIESEAEKYN